MTYITNKNRTNLIPPHGGYRNLKSYQMSEIIYDLTQIFCKKFVYSTYKTNKQSLKGQRPYRTYTRTYDQMVQAARSGKQNIAEGSSDSGTSKKTELKLVGIARGSLEELLLDYEDFLRQNNLSLWLPNDNRVKIIRNLCYVPNKSYTTYMTYMASAESACNCLICIIHQANYLLDRQLNTLQNEFLEKGGFTERLYTARKTYMSNNNSNKI